MKLAGVFLGTWLLLGLLFLFVPAIDLAVTGLFYAPGQGFPLAGWAPLAIVEGTVPWITRLIVGITALGALWLLLIGRPLWRLDRKALVFLVAATVLGPGLVANTVLKDYWGRARPSHIEAFGGGLIELSGGSDWRDQWDDHAAVTGEVLHFKKRIRRCPLHHRA